MENPIKMDDLGVPFFFGNIHMICIIWYIQSSLMKLLLSSGDSVSGVGGSAGVSWEWSCKKKKTGSPIKNLLPF